MKTITYVSDQVSDYSAALSKCTTLADLRFLTTDYGELCEDAKAIADQMTDTDFAEFAAGLKKERRSKFAGEEFSAKYGAVMMPEIMFKASMIAVKYHVPWGLAYLRMKETMASRPRGF